MVDSLKPERAEAAHSLVACEHIHDRVLQRMAHVQRASDVRGRDHNREHGSVLVSINFRSKISVLLPALIMMLLCLLGIVLFRYVHPNIILDFRFSISDLASLLTHHLSFIAVLAL